MSDASFHGLSHVDVPVTDLDRALRIYERLIGFRAIERGEGWVDLDAGSAIVRLVQTRRAEHPATLRLQAPDPRAALAALGRGGARVVHDVIKSPDQEWIGVAHDPDGNVLIVWRRCTEDEYDVEPELPKDQRWDPEAEALLKQLLRSVPALFRALARRKVAKYAEELAGKRRGVGREDVIRSFILSSPKITRGRNRQPLIDAGIDIARYEALFDED